MKQYVKLYNKDVLIDAAWTNLQNRFQLMRILMSLKELSSDIKDASTRRMITVLANSIDKEKKVIDTMPYIKQEPGLTF